MSWASSTAFTRLVLLGASLLVCTSSNEVLSAPVPWPSDFEAVPPVFVDCRLVSVEGVQRVRFHRGFGDSVFASPIATVDVAADPPQLVLGGVGLGFLPPRWWQTGPHVVGTVRLEVIRVDQQWLRPDQASAPVLFGFGLGFLADVLLLGLSPLGRQFGDARW